MLFASIEEVSLPARLCKVDFALDKVAPGRYAAAVVYLSSHAALRPLLDFLCEALSHGWGHASEVVGSYWVTDMSLVAAFVEWVDSSIRGWGANVTVFPAPHEVGRPGHQQQPHCLVRHMSHNVDAAVWGIWCCGDMGRGREWCSVKTENALSGAQGGLVG